MIEINKLKTTSLKVFEDCLLPNGCLVAAPVAQPYYPKDAKSYMYAWPGRDSGFALASMLLLGQDYYQPVLRWLWERAEDFNQSTQDEWRQGLIFKSYHPNGLVREHQFQPDQGGTLMWALGFKQELTRKNLSPLELQVLQKLADGYARIWLGPTFKVAVEDLWEERGATPAEGNFTYSLAAVATGLRVAGRILKEQKYADVAFQITQVLKQYCWNETEKIIPRKFKSGECREDLTVDGSLLGLVWPFNLGFPQEHLLATVVKIEETLLSAQGVHRYSGDTYKGADSHNHSNDKAGAWPLLTFWLSLACAQLDQKEKAEKYFNLAWGNLADEYIPEQIFCCELMPWTGIKPLLWSHAMFLLAAWKLGFLQPQALK